jgi:hypothetical protein
VAALEGEKLLVAAQLHIVNSASTLQVILIEIFTVPLLHPRTEAGHA